MRTKTLAAALVLLAALPLADLHAQDGGEPSLPFNPFAEAREGDWETLIFTFRRADGATTDNTSTWRVKKVTDDEVTLELVTVAPGVPKPQVMERIFSRKGKIALRDYFKLGPDEKLEDVKTSDKKLTQAGHVFEGKLLEATRSGGRVDGKCSLLLSPEVKGSGVVALEVQLAKGGSQTHMVVGFGTAEKKLWGKTAEEIVVVDTKAGETPEIFNLYKDRDHGFSIRAPHFAEIQDRQVAETFRIHGGNVTFTVLVQGDTSNRATFKAQSLANLEKSGFKVVKEIELTVSGKDALELEYTNKFDSAEGKVEGRVVDLFIFRDAHVITLRTVAPEKRFHGGKFEKSLRASYAAVKLIDIGGGDAKADRKNEEPGVYYDHVYGLRIPLLELPKGGKSSHPVVEFQGPIERHGNTSRIAVTVLEQKMSREEWKPEGLPGVEVVGRKELEVSGRPALAIETKATVKDRPTRGLSLMVFDKTRTYIVDATGAKAAWDEQGAAFRDSVTSFKLDP